MSQGKYFVARTEEEFRRGFASGEPFEASEELAAKCGFFPADQDTVHDEDFFAPNTGAPGE